VNDLYESIWTGIAWRKGTLGVGWLALFSRAAFTASSSCTVYPYLGN
jgi:hypothetical protein